MPKKRKLNSKNPKYMDKVEEVKASAQETDRLNAIVYKMMAQNCGKITAE